MQKVTHRSHQPATSATRLTIKARRKALPSTSTKPILKHTTKRQFNSTTNTTHTNHNNSHNHNNNNNNNISTNLRRHKTPLTIKSSSTPATPVIRNAKRSIITSPHHNIDDNSINLITTINNQNNPAHTNNHHATTKYINNKSLVKRTKSTSFSSTTTHINNKKHTLNFSTEAKQSESTTSPHNNGDVDGGNVDPRNFSEGGLSLARSRTNLVEVINGRSKRWLYDPSNKKKLHPQWMWHDDEEVFDQMLAKGRGRIQSTYHDVINSARSLAYSVLLPAGFPDSVHSCYGAFSTWQFVETSFNQFIHVLCSQAMLSCVGLPTDTASAAGGAVAIRWIAKDGIAHFSKLFFTKRFAYQLDFRPKTWGLVSELFFIFGSSFELSTAILAKYNSPEWFLPLAAFGASLQSVAHLAWEATHATFNKYLSLRNNLADVTAKADSQMVMSELLGMSLGLFYINYLNEPWHLWAAFLCVIPLHLGSTFGRLNAIKFGKLSSSRLLQHYNSFVQHRLGPTQLQPNVLPEDVLGATAEHIAPEIYTDKKKRIEYIKERMKRSELYNTELKSARMAAASAAAATTNTQNTTGTGDIQGEGGVKLSSNAILKPMSSTISTPSPVSPKTAAPSNTVNVNIASVGNVQPIQKKGIDPYQELHAVQQIMNFATPEQFHHTDRRLGEWFDTKAWVDIYGYPEIKMCAPIDEAFETEDELFGAVALFRDRHYLLNYRISTNKIYLTFEEECGHDDLMQSLLVATRLAYDIRKNGPPQSVIPSTTSTSSNPPIEGSNEALQQRWAPFNMIRESLQWSLRYEDQITALLADCDWDVDELTWPDTGARVYWEINDKPHHHHQQQQQPGVIGQGVGNSPSQTSVVQ